MSTDTIAAASMPVRPRRLRIGRMVWFLALILVLGSLLLPLIILVAVSVNPVSMVFPPQGFTLRWYAVILDKPEFLEAARASTIVALATATFSTILGVAAAIGLNRYGGRLRETLSFFLLSPLLIPAVIVALSTFQLIFAVGMTNNLAFLIAAHVVVTLPYPMRNVLAQLANFDIRLEEAAMTVGASPLQALWRVTLPMQRASIVPSFIITFVLSWNNYTVSLFLANRHWTTLPLQLRAYLQYEYEPFVAAMSTLVIIGSAVLLLVVDRTVGISGVSRK